MAELSRLRYAALYGPTAGDRIRLADTDLLIEVEQDLSAPAPGDEDFAGDHRIGSCTVTSLVPSGIVAST